MKEAITTAPVLAYYDPGKPLTLENDACEYGIGSALLQGFKPIAFFSRSLSESERRYAQIEKEMLAVDHVWAGDVLPLCPIHLVDRCSLSPIINR